MAAEELLMEGVSRGGDRQQLHEQIRKHAWAAREAVVRGEKNPLRSLLEADEILSPVVAALPDWDAQRFTGRAGDQTLRYLDQIVAKLPQPSEDHLTDLKV